MRALHERVTKIHPDHRRIARGAFWVATFVAAGKAVGAAKEIAIAWRYGVGELVDAYQLATTVVFWLPTVLVSVLSVVLIPTLVKARAAERAQGDLLIRELQGAAVAVGAALSVVSLAITLTALPYLTLRLSERSFELTWSFTKGMAPLAILALLIGVYSARLIAREVHLNTLAESIPAALLLLSVLYVPLAGVAPLLWGTLLGFAVHAIVLSVAARKADGAPLGFSMSRRSQYWTAVKKGASVMLIGQFVMSFITPLDQYTAAMLGDGAISTLSYSNRVTALLVGIGAVAVSRSALPVISEIHARGEAARARNVALKWSLTMLLLGLPLVAAAWVLAPWGIQLLFERGAFTAANTALATEVFRWNLPHLPFYFSGLVLVQLLVSQGRYGTIAVLAASNLVVKFGFNLTMTSLMGLPGISMATSLMMVWSAACLYFAVTRRRPSEVETR